MRLPWLDTDSLRQDEPFTLKAVVQTMLMRQIWVAVAVWQIA